MPDAQNLAAVLAGTNPQAYSAYVQKQQALANFQGLNGQQIAMPGAVAPSSSQTAPANVGQLVNNAYQGNLGAYNAQIGQQNNLNSGLFSLGAATLANSGITGSIGSAIGSALPFAL